MARNYQRKLNNSYRLPHFTYMRVVYIVRDYDRLKSEREDILHGGSGDFSVVKSSPGDPTANRAMRLCSLAQDIDAIETALKSIPSDYRKGVFNNVAYQSPYPIIAGIATWSRWRARFLYHVASNLALV